MRIYSNADIFLSLFLAQGYDTISKGKKSWSVRLGLARSSSGRSENDQDQQQRQKNWGTISSLHQHHQQYLYTNSEPWVYGTVRTHGTLVTPVLLVCACPEFLQGSTTNDIGGNCRKCGGHRLAGLPIGGTCRMPSATIRARPSLAGKNFLISLESENFTSD